MPKELKPCPFCGGKAKTIQYNDWKVKTTRYNGWKAFCSSCGIKTPDFYIKERYAIEFWNKRTP